METTAAEMKLLSNRFYGNKKFFARHHFDFKSLYHDEKRVTELVDEIFHDFTKELRQIDQNLLKLFAQFVQGLMILAYESRYSFIKTTCLIELSVHLFQTAWEKRWNKDKTFEELKQVLVRHSLFRPPHSVYVFTLDEVKQITFHYLNTLFRYYGAYFYVFTPMVDLVIFTREVVEKKDAIDEEIEAMRKEGEQYDQELDADLRQQLMGGNSIHNVSSKKREEMARLKAEQEQQERVDRVLKAKLEMIEREFEEKVKIQDQEFSKKIEDLKHQKKGKK